MTTYINNHARLYGLTVFSFTFIVRQIIHLDKMNKFVDPAENSSIHIYLLKRFGDDMSIERLIKE